MHGGLDITTIYKQLSYGLIIDQQIMPTLISPRSRKQDAYLDS